MRRILVATAGILALLLLVVYFPSFRRAPSPEELAEQALGDGPLEDREKAAVELSRCGTDAVEPMRRVLRGAKEPAIRSAVINGLGRLNDLSSMPELLDAMEDESPQVRGRAGAAVRRLAAMDFHFRAHGDPSERAKAVAAYRRFWKGLNDGDPALMEHLQDPNKIKHAQGP